jgi:hypothetical protein
MLSLSLVVLVLDHNSGPSLVAHTAGHLKAHSEHVE